MTTRSQNFTSIVFIDSKVDNYLSLISGITSEVKIVLLNPTTDGIKAITETLQTANYQQVHIVSHGSPGCLYLGNSQLSLDTLEQYQTNLRSWFSPPHTIHPKHYTLLIYGCNVAAGDAGTEFIAKLKQLTGAEIAATANPTGNKALGGDWKLEFTTTDDLDVNLAIDEATRLAYQGVLNTFTVTTADDEDDGDFSEGDLSLREAIALANEQEGADTITFDSSLSGGAIALTETQPDPRGLGTINRDLSITDSVTITGLGAGNLTIDGNNGGGGIFIIGGENTDVTIEGLTITNGNRQQFFFQNATLGGAIFVGSNANLTLRDSEITGSSASSAGALFNAGNVNIIGSLIANNVSGGGDFPGGAIGNTGNLNIVNSTIANNSGRGLGNRGISEIANSTIIDGIDNFGVDSSTTITSSIVSSIGGNGVINSGGNNLIGNGDDVDGLVDSDLVGTADNPIDPQLGELQDNGGATFTIALLEGSPAIDAGSNPNNLTTDQRGA